jgi:hypothetical protein
VTDWENQRLRINLRVAAAEERLEEVRRRRAELAAGPAAARNVQRANQRVLEAVEHAAAARLAAANQLERSAKAHDAAAYVHDAAAKRATNDLEVVAHMHICEAHRSAARNDRELVRSYREHADGIDDLM